MLAGVLGLCLCFHAPLFVMRHSRNFPRGGRSGPCLTEDGTEPAAAPPVVGVHPGVLCDKTLNPIVGYRYTVVGQQPSYDLCEEEFAKLPQSAQRRFQRIAPPLTPRRVLLFAGAAAAAVTTLTTGRLSLSLQPRNDAPAREREAEWDADDIGDIRELPPLSPAENLLGRIFRPAVAGATESSTGEGVKPTCDEACRQRIADRRALFEQSRTTSDRQKILDLSKQRAAMYNTTFQGAACVPGLPCW
jgi:hypothetical protein